MGSWSGGPATPYRGDEPYWNCPECGWGGDTAPWNSDVTKKLCPECGSTLKGGGA